MTGNSNSTSSTNPVQQAPGKVERYTRWALQNLKIGLAEDGQPFLYKPGPDNWIAHPLMSRLSKRLLRKAAHSQGDILRNDELGETLDNLYAHAAVDDARLQVHLRVGRSDDGVVEVDLGTQDGKRVRLQDGVAQVITAGSQTIFTRPESMLPMPTPAAEGDWRQLLPFLNMRVDHQYLLIGFMTWALCHPRHTAPYPILVLLGEQGTGKSLLCRSILRPLVDNNAAGIQLLPSELRDIAISCRHQHLLIYDNLRSLTKRQSDYLCVTATGGSVGSRRLYTNDEESLLPVHTPVVLNGIHNFAHEPDIISRIIALRTLPFDTNSRREETEIARELEQKLPGICHGLLDLGAQALQREASVAVLHQTRMMSFSRWLAALEPVMGMQQGELQQAYADNLREAALETVQENALAITALRFAAGNPGGCWKGTPSDLLGGLSDIAPPRTIHRPAEWPQTAISLSKRLKQIAPLLMAQGLDISFSHGTQRQISFTYTPPEGEKILDEIDEPDGEDPGRSPPTSLEACMPVQAQGGDFNAKD